MNRIIVVFTGLLLVTQQAYANPSFNECLGRINFESTDRFEWATFRIEHSKINSPGGHAFSKNIYAVSDYVSYDYDELTIRISDITTREKFDRARNAILYQSEAYKDHLRDRLRTNERLLQSIKRMNYSADIIKNQENEIKTLEEDIKKTKTYEHQLDIPDAHILGSKETPYEFLLWRNNRVFYFHMNKPAENAAQRIKDLAARFEARDLYQVPSGPGVCMPYGFIHDDGKTGFSVKNSLRFTSTPNVIMSLINASLGDPTKPTRGTYDTDYRPGYDAEKWKKSKIMEKFYIGERMTTLEGWRLDPRPESAEQDRAWFAIAHVGGLASPLIAAQMFTFQKGTDGLKDLTPLPEAVIPKFLKLTQSISSQ
ncbi:hypothetical protein QMK54_13515 [Pseudomonas sp. P5_109]|uniref:hypothetical protein n=1 Tax=Pseudomonas sp. P5_109 TaxID=3043441 RepID=UPI002A36BBC4|nr:hypothetical protein [Pseudomonas sp. P5_109]WPN32698.1 hypothetical protein QMK54_13515 [Pseudomonas sp. P5_109]